MSKPEPSGSSHHEQDKAQGPNLKVLYGLIALALAAAIAIAALIVLPFYLRR